MPFPRRRNFSAMRNYIIIGIAIVIIAAVLLFFFSGGSKTTQNGNVTECISSQNYTCSNMHMNSSSSGYALLSFNLTENIATQYNVGFACVASNLSAVKSPNLWQFPNAAYNNFAQPLQPNQTFIINALNLPWEQSAMIGNVICYNSQSSPHLVKGICAF